MFPYNRGLDRNPSNQTDGWERGRVAIPRNWANRSELPGQREKGVEKALAGKVSRGLTRMHGGYLGGLGADVLLVQAGFAQAG